jgi:hypothetical protein
VSVTTWSGAVDEFAVADRASTYDPRLVGLVGGDYRLVPVAQVQVREPVGDLA